MSTAPVSTAPVLPVLDRGAWRGWGDLRSGLIAHTDHGYRLSLPADDVDAWHLAGPHARGRATWAGVRGHR